MSIDRKRRAAAGLAIASLSLGCNSILGIHELSDDQGDAGSGAGTGRDAKVEDVGANAQDSSHEVGASGGDAADASIGTDSSDATSNGGDSGGAGVRDAGVETSEAGTVVESRDASADAGDAGIADGGDAGKPVDGGGAASAPDAGNPSCTAPATRCDGQQPQTCNANRQWENAGATCAGCFSCAMATGACAPATGSPCDDGNACTLTDTCSASGVCVGSNPVACPAPAACHSLGICNPTSGTCSTPTITDGMSCGTGGMACSGGACGCPASAPALCAGSCVDTQTSAANCGACGHGCAFAGATCSAGKCQPVTIAPNQVTPSWLLTDATRIYWLTNDANLGGTVVAAANKDGTATGALNLPFVPQPAAGPILFAEGQNPPAFYWVENATTNPLQGTPFIFGPINIASPTQMPLALFDGAAVDIVAGPTAMYWTNADANGIQAMGTDGTAQVFAPPLYTASIPVAIAADATNLYWSEVVGQPGTSRVVKAPQSGAGPVVPLSTGLTVAGNPRTVAVNGTNVYFVNRINGGVALDQAPIAGGTTTQLLTTGNPVAVAADASGVYWLDSTAGAVLMVVTGTTTVVTVAPAQSISTDVSGAIAVDSLGIYWGTASAVMAVAK